MAADIYINILEELMFPYAEDSMPLLWAFHQDDNPKHKAFKGKR